jgi:hypothetical protein
MMSTSVSGNCAEARHLRVDASTTETFIEDVPKSIPNNSILKKI